MLLVPGAIGRFEPLRLLLGSSSSLQATCFSQSGAASMPSPHHAARSSRIAPAPMQALPCRLRLFFQCVTSGDILVVPASRTRVSLINNGGNISRQPFRVNLVFARGVSIPVFYEAPSALDRGLTC